MSLAKEGSRDTDEGILVSIYPDVCMTPCGSSMVPVPYNIWAKQSDQANTTPTVRFTSQRTHNMGSLITTCYGDEAGTGGGVKSGTNKGICEPLEHSATVRAEGKNSIRHDDVWWMNNKNTLGRLLWVKEPDTTALTSQSGQDWKVRPIASAASVRRSDEGVVLSDATPDPILAGQVYAQAQPALEAYPATAPMPTAPAVAATPAGGNVVTGPWPGSGTGAAGTSVAEGGLDAAGAGLAEGGANAAGSVAAEGGASIAELGGAEVLGDILAPEIVIPITLGVLAYQYWLKHNKMQDKPAETQSKPQPAGRTENNCNISAQKKEPPCPCTVGKYEEIKNICKAVCGDDAQAHHIVPDFMLRYGNRDEGETGENRIPAPAPSEAQPPSFADGPAICLQGNAGTSGTEHNVAHGCDEEIAEQGSIAPVKGTIKASEGVAIAVNHAIAARPDCSSQIKEAVNKAFGDLDPDMLLRTTQQPPKPGSPAYQQFNPLPDLKE